MRCEVDSDEMAGGENHRLLGICLPKTRAHLGPAHSGQVDIENDDVRLELPDCVEHRFAGVHLQAIHALERQHRDDPFSHGLIVLDEKDAMQEGARQGFGSCLLDLERRRLGSLKEEMKGAALADLGVHQNRAVLTINQPLGDRKS